MLNQPPTIPSLHKFESPRKKKGQISFAAPTNFSLDLDSIEDSSNRKTAEEIKFLTNQLQKVKKERDVLQEHCDSLEHKLQSIHQHTKEVLLRRQMEEESFRNSLSKAKSEFDSKFVKLSIKTKDREDVLLDWVTTVGDLSLYSQHDSLQDLRARTLSLLPPSLRELVRGARRQTGGRSTHMPALRGKRGKKSAKHKAAPKKASVASTDPDALLAIINENISVLDHFNLLHLQDDRGGELQDSEVSDLEDAAAMLRGDYSEYMHSGAHAAVEGPAPLFSSLAAQARTEAEEEGMEKEQEHRPATKASANSSRQGSRSDRATAGSSPSSRAGTGRARPRRPMHSRSPSRAGSSARAAGDDDEAASVDSGTVTGSIMDHNDALSSDEEERYPRLHLHSATGAEEEEGAGASLYDVSLWSHPLSLTAPAPGPHLPATPQQSNEGLQGSASQLQQVPRTPRSTAVPAPGSTTQGKGEHVAAISRDQLAVAMQGLQDLSKMPSAEQHRRMSQMSSNYTDMVRNVLDSVSELSKSDAAEEHEGERSSDKDQRKARRRGGPVLETEGSGIETDLVGLMQELDATEASTEHAHNPTVQITHPAKPGYPTAGVSAAQSSSTEQPLSLDALLLRAGVTLDALSSATEHEDEGVVYTPFTQNSAEAALSLATGASLTGQQGQQQAAVVYSEQDIERMIHTATSLDENSDLEDSDMGNTGQKKKQPKKKGRADSKNKTAGSAQAKGQQQSSSSRVSKAQETEPSVSAAGGSRGSQQTRSAVDSRAGSAIDYSFDFESEPPRSQHSVHSHRISSNKQGTAGSSNTSRAAAEGELKLGGDWDDYSEYTTV